MHERDRVQPAELYHFGNRKECSDRQPKNLPDSDTESYPCEMTLQKLALELGGKPQFGQSAMPFRRERRIGNSLQVE
jgi:hypothetical protein